MELSEKKCPFCAETIKAEAIRCKHCHADVSISDVAATDQPPPAKGMSVAAKVCITVVLIVIAFLGFGALVGNTPEGKAKAHARAAIDLCHHEEETYTGPAGSRAIISGACRKLEADFKAQFGYAP